MNSTAPETLSEDEQRARLIERTARAIYAAAYGVTLSDSLRSRTALIQAWSALNPTTRTQFRQQARAALGATDLLKQAEELEQRITRAKGAVLSALEQPSHRSARARQDMHNAVRVLSGEEIQT
jgi:hypothetical protein